MLKTTLNKGDLKGYTLKHCLGKVHFRPRGLKENVMADKIGMIYDARLSIEENAEKCDVSVARLRQWLIQHNIDRRFDAQLVRFKAIKKLQRRTPPLSARQISEKTGYSLNTVKKYMRMDSFDKPSVSDKLSTFDVSCNETIIKSVSYDQQQILNDIIKLYIPHGYIQADFTFSIGLMYRENKVPVPQLRFDKFPYQGIYADGGVLPLEEAEDIIEEGELHSCIVDLPFLITKRKWTENSKMAQRFNVFNDIDEATEANKYMLGLAYRKLKKKGILIMKTQDLYTEGKQIWMHRFVQEWAEQVGFKLIDMFILIAQSRMLGNGLSQRVARKYHSYFLVFRK